MERQEEELIKSLLSENAELKDAYEEHLKLKTQVEELTSRGYLSPPEEVERKELQKRKLASKDKVMRILAEHRRGVNPA